MAVALTKFSGQGGKAKFTPCPLTQRIKGHRPRLRRLFGSFPKSMKHQQQGIRRHVNLSTNESPLREALTITLVLIFDADRSNRKGALFAESKKTLQNPGKGSR